MTFSTVSQELVRYMSHAGTVFLDAKSPSRQHLSVAVEWLALVFVWSAVMAMSLAVVASLLGEQ